MEDHAISNRFHHHLIVLKLNSHSTEFDFFLSLPLLLYEAGSDLEMGELSSSKEEVLPWLPICHALSHKNDSAYQWMEHLRSVFKGASCTQLTFSKVSVFVIQKDLFNERAFNPGKTYC